MRGAMGAGAIANIRLKQGAFSAHPHLGPLFAARARLPPGEFDDVPIGTARNSGSEFMANFVGTDGPETITGTEGSDIIELLGGDDVAFGLEGSDYFYGGQGRDTFEGGGGNDWMHAEPGDDVFDGGDGFDRGDYSGAPAGIRGDLINGEADDGYGGKDIFISVEGLAGSDFDDLLIGDDGDLNSFTGGLGDDTITGNGGFDFVWYGRAPAGVAIDLAAGTASGGEGNDVLSGIEGVSGGNYDDTILGNAEDNLIVLDQTGDAFTPDTETGGADYADAAAGFDTVSFGAEGDAVEVDLEAERAIDARGNTDTKHWLRGRGRVALRRYDLGRCGQ